jgi:hypothetical protein
MKIITVINDQRHAGFNFLRLSCALNNLELVCLVYNQPTFPSNRIKDKLLKNYLDTKVPPDETILFTDGNDAIFMAMEDEILQKFHKTGKEVLFSTETGCWPDVNLADQYPPENGSPYRFLNSGGFIGTAGAISQLLEDESFDTGNYKKSNQYLWAKRFFKYPDRIGLDTACDLFYTFSPEKGAQLWDEENPLPYYIFMKDWFDSNFQIQKHRIFSKITNTWPCHAHFNGDSKILIDPDIIGMVFSQIPTSRKAQFIPGELKAVKI